MSKRVFDVLSFHVEGDDIVIPRCLVISVGPLMVILIGGWVSGIQLPHKSKVDGVWRTNCGPLIVSYDGNSRSVVK